MGKAEKHEKFCLQLSESSKQPEILTEIMHQFEKVCLGEIREDELSELCRFQKQYGIDFFGEDDKEIGSVYFENPLEYREFCEMLENCTSTYDERGLPKIKYNTKAVSQCFSICIASILSELQHYNIHYNTPNYPM